MNVRETLVLNSEESLAKAMDEMLRNEWAVVIVKDGKYLGIIDNLNISHGISDASKVKCVNACVRAPSLTPSSELFERLNAFLNGHYRALPVLEEKSEKVLGVTTRFDLLRELSQQKLVPKKLAAEVMNRPVYTVDYNESVTEARNLLKSYGAHKLVVTRNGKPVGIFSMSDIIIASLLTKPKGRKDQRIVSQVKSADSEERISQHLRESIVEVPDTAELEDIVRKMAEKEVSSVVVTANGKLAGIISAFDMFKLILDSAKKGNDGIAISGLSGEDAIHYDEVLGSIQKVLGKASKSLDIKHISVHFKKSKSVYKANIYLELPHEHIAFSTEEFDFKTTLDALVSELYTLLKKRKDIMNDKKGRARKED